MKLFLAGLHTSNFDIGGRIYHRLTDPEKVARDAVDYYLESYHYVHKPAMVRRMRKDGIRIFLDSGAYSAYTQGIEVDLGAYCDYIHANQDIIEFPSVLDAIGDAEGTWRNQEAMERRGVVPLPCYHYGEPPAVLQHYIANYPLVTIGGMVPISTPQLRLWLDDIWEKYICDAEGVPKVNIHGFGLTSLPLMLRYPWYSVDSSSWVQWAANGGVFVLGRGNFSVSAVSPSAKKLGQHLDSITPIEREAVLGFISWMGFDPDRLRHEYISRWAFNALAFTLEGRRLHDLQQGMAFKREQGGLF